MEVSRNYTWGSGNRRAKEASGDGTCSPGGRHIQEEPLRGEMEGSRAGRCPVGSACLSQGLCGGCSIEAYLAA